MSGHTNWREIRHKRGALSVAQQREAAAALEREIARYWSWRGLPRRLADRWHDWNARTG